MSNRALLSVSVLALSLLGRTARADDPGAAPPAPVKPGPADGEAPAPVDNPSPGPTDGAPQGAPGAAPDGAPQAPPEGAPAEPPQPIDVSIAGTRVKETSGSAHIVRAKQLERFEYDDPHQVLLGVPGVYVRGEDGYGLRPNIGMRGAVSDRSKKITLMEDGVLLGPAPYSAPAAYYFPLITRMNAVRVVKGPSTIVHGPHTVAGAIDMVTASIPSGRKTTVDAAFGQYLYRKVHLRQSFADETRGVLVEGVHIGTAGFKELDGGGDTGFSRNEFMAKGSWSLGTVDTLFHDVELKLGYSGETSNETYLGLTDEDFRATPYRRYAASALDRMEWHRTQIALTHRVTDGAGLTIQTTAYRHDMHRIWRKVNAFGGASIADVLADPTSPRNAVYYGVLTGGIPASTSDERIMIGPNDRTYVSQGIQTTLRWNPMTGPISHRLEIGTRIHQDSIQRVHTQDGFHLDGGAPVPAGGATETTADNDASTTALAAHVIDAATWGRLTVTGGVRVESIHGVLRDRLTGRTDGVIQQVLLPGGGAFVALPYDLGVFAGAYQGFSPVPPGQSSNVRPEKSVNYEGGVRFSPKRFRAEVIGFYNDYTNLSNVCTVSTGCVQENVDQQFDGGRAVVYGVEAYVESEWKPRRDLAIPGRIAYTFTEARFGSSFQSSDPIFGDVEEGDVIPYIPQHQLSASVGVEMERWAANVAGTYVSPMREIAGQGEAAAAVAGEATDASFVVDASVSVRPLAFLTVYLNGRNLGNQAFIVSRRPFGARPGAPISVQGGVKVDF